MTVDAPAAVGLRSVEPGLIRRVWSLLANVRFALAMILLLVVLTFLGTAISQVPPPMRQDKLLVERWLLAMERQYGPLTPILDRAGAFNVFEAPAYRALLALLTISVTACTLRRAPAIWRNVFITTPQRRVTYYASAPLHARTEIGTVSVHDAVRAAEVALEAHGYRTVLDASGSNPTIYADRYRFFRLATFVNHLGLIMILGGGTMTGVLGQRNDGLVVPVGSSRQVGLDTPYVVRVDSFSDEYHLGGVARDYRSEVAIIDGDREIARATIRVNEPLSVGPVRLHQAYFGQAIVLDVARNGRSIFRDAVPLAYTALPYGFRPVGFFELPVENLAIDLVAPDPASEDVPAGQIAIFGYPRGSSEPVFTGVLSQREPQRWRDLEFTFLRETQFTGLQAVRDPGAPVFFVAAALMLGGILAVLYFPHRRAYALVDSDAGTPTLWLAGHASRDPNFEDEFRSIVARTSRELVATEGGP